MKAFVTCPRRDPIDLAMRGTHFWFLTALLCLAGAFSSSDTSAQYMYLDTDGDSASTTADLLDPVYPTTVNIWLVTNQNRDGSTALCAVGGGALTINSYEFIVKSDSGAVSWGSFENRMSAFTYHFQGASSPTELHEGYGSGSALAPGRYLLATVEVTVLSGTPRLVPSGTSSLSGSFLTGFGSQCAGGENDNTLALGRDWMDVDGVGTGTGGGEGMQQSVTTNEGVIYLGGNRMAAPLTLSFESQEVVVNGRHLPVLPPPPPIRASSRDSLRCQLDSDATTLARAGVRRGLSRDELLESLRALYASSVLVREASRDRGAIRVTYAGSPASQSLVNVPANVPMTDLSDVAQRRLATVRAYSRLLEAKRDLDQGAMLIVSQNGWTTAPPSLAQYIDEAFQSIQAGTKLTDAQRQLLERTIVPELQSEIKNPIPLQTAGGNE